MNAGANLEAFATSRSARDAAVPSVACGDASRLLLMRTDTFTREMMLQLGMTLDIPYRHVRIAMVQRRAAVAQRESSESGTSHRQSPISGHI